MNRFFRRMQQFGKRFSENRSQGLMHDKQHDLDSAARPQDVASERQKGSRHKKMTADKWNQ